ncbi:MAG: S-adenosylmethionine:tRNA ribosyltransferase-isomerase [Muribaculaceae bacterium]|nr:S-adenosylmethionine:tRNA ribosyltransferase-isomerase [Muribaculaceae bacterium]
MNVNDIRDIRISDYNYPLPDERIAKHPLAQREQCKLLCWHDGNITDHHFHEVPTLLPPQAMLIYNNTRVINARLRFRKQTGSLIEIFCLEPHEPHDYELVFQTTHRCTWQCLVGNSKRWKQGELTQHLIVDGQDVTLTATRGEQLGNAWTITFTWDGDGVTFASVLEAVGEIPIPPYLNRSTESSDSIDYQTVYSHIDGSVAAPTAGLHFTDALLAECDAKGIRRRELTLHVGAGTFQPVKSEQIGDHDMHYEFVQVSRSLIKELIDNDAPVIAVGTTSVRTLESLYFMGQILSQHPDATDLTVLQWMPYTTPCAITAREALLAIDAYLERNGLDQLMGSTQLMIAPGFQYRIIDGMITNFHQPQSTLLLLVSAFTGADRWRAIYDHALAGDYRFLSYGDACLLLRNNG